MAGGQGKAATTLNVDTVSKIPSLEKALKSGRINIILVFAEWCGACHKFRKNIWNPMMRKNAMHNRIAIRDDMVGKTSLANTKFDYLPSILVVDEKGVAQTFNTPEGKITNAMPTPKNLDDMTRVVNVPVTGVPTAPAEPAAPVTALPNGNVAVRKNQDTTNTQLNESPLTIAPKAPVAPLKKESKIPEGVVYTPTPSIAPQRGGNLLAGLESASRGVIPATVLGSLVFLMRGGRNNKHKMRKTRKGKSKVKRTTRRI